MKICSVCVRTLPLEKFSPGKGRCRECINSILREKNLDPVHREKSRLRSSAHRKNNPEAVNAANRKYAKKHPDKAKKWSRQYQLKTLGWTQERWDQHVAAQAGLCAIKGCGRLLRDADHCHRTGKARGAICSECNKALGLLGESLARLLGLIEYLELYKDAEDS